MATTSRKFSNNDGSNRGFDELAQQLRDNQQAVERLRTSIDGLSVSIQPLTRAIQAAQSSAQVARIVQQVPAINTQVPENEESIALQREQLETLKAMLQQQGSKAKSADSTRSSASSSDQLALYAQEVGGLAINLQNLLGTVIDVQLERTDQAISLQRERLRDLRKDGEETNGELIRLEEERLQKLQEQRERFVRQQQALAVVELAANAAVAISKAAAQGGAAAPFTIAATLIALAAGLAKARAQAQAAIPRAERGGIVGKGHLVGPRHHEGGILIEAEGGERILDRHTSAAYAPLLDWLVSARPPGLSGLVRNDGVLSVIPAVHSIASANHPRTPDSEDLKGIREELQELRRAVEGQERLNVRIDESGLHGVVSRWNYRGERANRRAH